MRRNSFDVQNGLSDVNISIERMKIQNVDIYNISYKILLLKSLIHFVRVETIKWVEVIANSFKSPLK